MRRRIIILLFVTCVLLLIGCVPSLNPFYTDKYLIELPGIDGTWIDQDDCKWEFKNNGYLSYQLTYNKDTNVNEDFDAHLFRLGNQIFMDLYPKGDGAAFRSKEGLSTIHYFPSHTISKLQLSGNTLNINMLNPEWMKKMKEEQKIFIKYEEVEDGLLLTAKPEDLQRFIQAYAYDSDAFEKPNWQLRRVKVKEAITISTTSTIQVNVIGTNDVSTATTLKYVLDDAPNSKWRDSESSRPTLYFTPLSNTVKAGEPFELNIVLDNPQEIPIEEIGLWVRYNPKAVKIHETQDESPIEWDASFISGWTRETVIHNPSSGEIYLQLKAGDVHRLLTGVIGKLEFEGTGRVRVTPIQFKFNDWNSLPNTFITYMNRDAMGREIDHKDGTIGATIRIEKEKFNSNN